MRIALTADHNGTAFATRLAARLREQGHDVDDRTPRVAEGELVDYPPLCADVCRRVVDGAAERALVISGSGSGETIACNKIRGIRAGLCHDVWGAEISRGNNDSNVLVLGAKVVTPELADQILDTWLRTRSRAGSTPGGWPRSRHSSGTSSSTWITQRRPSARLRPTPPRPPARPRHPAPPWPRIRTRPPRTKPTRRPRPTLDQEAGVGR